MSRLDRDYTIIIPTCSEKNIYFCLEAVKNKQPGGLEKVLVYDNDPGLGVSAVCDQYGVQSFRERGVPFVFSRAINTCMFSHDNDVIILNDDAILQQEGGFDRFHNESSLLSEYGIVSASIVGFVGNPEQLHQDRPSIRPAALHTIVFICVHISRDVITKLGPLDERLVHYGWEDNLYCLQARAAGYKLGIYDGCIVEHGISLPSTYRTKPTTNLTDNRIIFEAIVREKCLEPHWPVPFEFPVKEEMINPVKGVKK